jgi:periplasmic protein TonB
MTKTLIRTLCLAGSLACVPFGARAQSVPPKMLTAPEPSYPVALTDTGLVGDAEVDLTVKTDGSVGNVELAVATKREFGKALLAAVKSWRFAPATRDGVPVEMQVTIPFVFTPPNEQVVNAVMKRKVFVKLPTPAISQKDYGEKLKVKTDFRPIFPRSLASMHDEVTVEVNFVVAPDGTTLNPTIVGSPLKEFILPALVAVARASYEPPTKDGQPVYVETSTKLDFDNYVQSGGGGGMPSMGGGKKGH